MVTVPTYLATEILFGRAEVVAEEGGREGGTGEGGAIVTFLSIAGSTDRAKSERWQVVWEGRGSPT